MISEQQVLDHGYVKLLDVLGDDWTPVRAARVSYNQPLKGPDADRKLLRYLLRNHHTTPFEQVVLTWEMKLPIFVARQIIRHRTASVNEFSMRYAEAGRVGDGEIEFYLPEQWRAPDATNKQGSLLTDFLDKTIDQLYSDACDDAITIYNGLLDAGVATEMARMVLPVSVYTKWIWTNDLHNTLHFLNLRLDEHAQWETRQYAKAMAWMMRKQLPETMDAWDEVSK